MRGWLRAARILRQHDSQGYFRPPPEFREIVRREQLRSDRSGQSFSLVTFCTHEKAGFDQHLRQLEKVFAARLRVTDEAGLLEKRKLGVVLPYTPASGAWKVADDLQRLSQLSRVTCEVFEYPAAPSLDEVVEQTDQVRPAPVPVLLAHGERYLFQRSDSYWKHMLDMIGAATALVAFSPVMLTAALAIKLTSPGPILFCQQREGRHGKRFAMYKLRTMHAGAEAMQAALRESSEQDGPAFKMTNDPRVTPVGRILRSTSIDEMPQFWNVLRREMSLVGPRPLPVDESSSCDAWQRRRLDVMPGLTCIWQVCGRSRVSFDEWVRMDLRYIRSRSLLLDLKLLMLTIPAVLSRRGAK